MARTPSVEYVGVLLALSLLLNSPIVNSLWTHRAMHPLKQLVQSQDAGNLYPTARALFDFTSRAAPANEGERRRPPLLSAP